MYYTHRFNDPSVKKEGVTHNSVDMIFAYFWSTMQTAYPAFTGMTIGEIGDTKDWIKQWVNDNYEHANLTTIADFASRLVDDYIENNVDREADRGN